MRVMVADDVLISRAGISALLEDSGCEVVGLADDCDSAVAVAARHLPDVAIIDIRMPPTHTDEGLVAAQRIRAANATIGILVLSQYVEPAYALRLIADQPAGLGYLLKDRIADSAILSDAMARLVAGQCVIDESIVTTMMRRASATSPLARLSERERAVLDHLAQGRSNAAIATALFITERTVESHTTQIFSKLDLPPGQQVHRRVLAVLRYLQQKQD